MSKKNNILPEINIGLVGHVDHGKTTLTAALSGKWTDEHSEELKRGITIKLGYADTTIRKCSACPDKFTVSEKCPECGGKTEVIRKVSFIDSPGHETLMAIMISGAAIIDGALLLVSANEDCPQPQTQEHLMALKILGIKNIVVIQNKIDLVSKDKVLENYNQIKEFVKESLGFEVPIIPVSAQKKVNIDLVVKAIQDHIPTPERDTTKYPEMLVARSFDINKPGTDVEKLIGGVIGGAITQGIFKKGQEIEIVPGLKIDETWKPIKTKIESIVVGSTFVDEKGPGGSIAFSTTLDPGVVKGDAFVGNTVALPGKVPQVYKKLDLKTTLFNKVIGTKDDIKIEPFKQYEHLMLSAGTATTVGVVQKATKYKIELTLRRPIAAHKEDKVAISRQIGNRWRLIGFGTIQ